MNDWRLKPPKLRSVVRDRLPDEKKPLPSLSEVSAILSDVRTGGLLSERLPDTADRKIADAWRTAIDGWVERVLLISSSREPDKRWVGVCLLGVTCEECCSNRFQSSYPVWFQKLLENLQSPSSTRFEKVACCASLADFFTRLSEFSSFKKDGTSFAGKTVEPVLQLLNEDAGDNVWEGVANLLSTLINYFPSSIQRHCDNVEAVLSSKIMAAECKLNTCKKFAHCLALFPKVKGDENRWSLIMQKILIALNSILTDAFQGLEEEKKGSEIMKMIIPPGKETPPPLGGQPLLGEASEPAIKRLRELLFLRVCTLMHACCIMLTNSYSFQVLVPVCSLIATVGRVLQMDGSFPFTTSMHQELLCATLQDLHLFSLDLLIAIIKCLRSQLLPHGANVVRLLAEYFRSAKLSSIRIKVYTILEMLLISMGVGMALYLSREVINNAFDDLFDCIGSGTKFSITRPSIVVGEAFRQNYQRKRKRALVSPVKYPNEVDLSLKTINKRPQHPLSVKIAALKALNALLTVGGSLRSECWRPDVDCLLIMVATNSCDAGWAEEDKVSLLADESSTHLDFQLAALETLLASLLSPTQTRPRYLSQGLDLFHRGKQETGTKIAAFCSHALLALEVLIHPRALPLADPPLKSSLDEEFGKRFAGSTSIRGDMGLLDGVDEEQCNYWFDDIDEQTLVQGGILNDKHTEPSSRVSEGIIEKQMAINSEVNHDGLECENTSSPSIDVEMPCLVREENTVERDKESKSRNETIYIASNGKVNFSTGSSAVPAMEIALGRGVSPSGISANVRNHGSDALDTSANSIKEGVDTIRSSHFNKGNDAMLSYDSNSASEDSTPDIVDGDPDTD